jgi:hypothetical protein
MAVRLGLAAAEIKGHAAAMLNGRFPRKVYFLR